MNKRINKWNICAISWIIIVFLLAFFMRDKFRVWNIDEYNEAGLTYSEVNLSTGTISQELVLSDAVQTVNMLVVNRGEPAECQVEIRNADTGETVWEGVMLVPASAGSETIVSLGVPEYFLKAGHYYLNFISSTSEQISVCVADKDYGASYIENEQNFQKHIRMQVVYGATSDLVLLGLITAALLVVGLSMIYAIKTKTPVEKIFVVCSLTFGILFALVNPFGQEADGWVHFERSVDVSNGNLLLPIWDNNGAAGVFRLPANINDVDFIRVDPDGVTAPKFVENIRGVYFSDTVIDADVFGGWSSFFYYPQAVGILIARLLGLSAYWWMVFGRIMNLICYTALTYIGIKRTPVYKGIFIVIALLPMSVYQAASVSYDAMVNAFSFLFIGLCLDLAYGEKKKLGWKDTLPLGIVLAMLFTSKYIYICLGLLVFLIPKEKFGGWKEYFRAFAISLLPIMLCAAMIILPSLISSLIPSVIAEETTNAATQGSIEETAKMTQMGYVLQNPLRYAKILVMTLVNQFEFYVKMFNTLGWMNYSLSHMQFFVPLFMMVVAVLDTNGVTAKIKLYDKVIMISTFALVLVLGMTGLYLFDANANALGAQVISGYQPRYAIPGMIVLLSFFASDKIKNEIKNFTYGVAGVMALFLMYSVLTIFKICY